jgi:hypothetical protein
LRAKIRLDETESAGCGGTTAKDNNEVWPDFGRNPKRKGEFPRLLRPSSLKYTRYSSLLASRTRKNPFAAVLIALTGPYPGASLRPVAFETLATAKRHAFFCDSKPIL